MRKTNRLAFKISASTHHFRVIVEQVGNYLQYLPDWELMWQGRHFFWAGDDVWESNADAVIVADGKQITEKVRKRFRGRIIVVSNRHKETFADQIISNDYDVGALAAEYLHGLGLRRFVFVTMQTQPHFSQQRWTGFCDKLMSLPNCEVIAHEWTTPPNFDKLDAFEECLQTARQRWRNRFGIYCETDSTAFMITRAAEKIGLSIPEDAALLGTDNNPLMCTLSHPRLSSIELNSAGIAQKVVEMLRTDPGENAANCQCIRISPLAVHKRRSTEIVAVDDPVVAKAMGIIKSSYRELQSVEELTALAGVSRRSLEMRFKQTLQATPYNELLRAKVSAARELLLNTDYAIAQVAEISGFTDIRTFNNVFRRFIGNSPTLLRKKRTPPLL